MKMRQDGEQAWNQVSYEEWAFPATPESPAIFTNRKSLVLQTLMKEKKESHHTVKYRGLKERKRQKAIIKRRQKKHKSAKTQHKETRTITNDVLWFESPISQFFIDFIIRVGLYFVFSTFLQGFGFIYQSMIVLTAQNDVSGKTAMWPWFEDQSNWLAPLTPGFESPIPQNFYLWYNTLKGFLYILHFCRALASITNQWSF